MDIGQTVYIGYVTSNTAYDSGDTTGTFEDANSFEINEKTGSWTSTPNKANFTLPNVPAGLVRITWRTNTLYNASLTNTTCWLYIDNVKVRIKSN